MSQMNLSLSLRSQLLMGGIDAYAVGGFKPELVFDFDDDGVIDSLQQNPSHIYYSEGIYSALDQTEEDGQVAAVEKLVIDVINRTTKSW